MLVRISLIVAILAGLAIGVLNFTQVKEKITTLQKEKKEQTDRAVTAEKLLADTKRLSRKPKPTSPPPRPLLRRPRRNATPPSPKPPKLPIKPPNSMPI